VIFVIIISRVLSCCTVGIGPRDALFFLFVGRAHNFPAFVPPGYLFHRLVGQLFFIPTHLTHKIYCRWGQKLAYRLSFSYQTPKSTPNHSFLPQIPPPTSLFPVQVGQPNSSPSHQSNFLRRRWASPKQYNPPPHLFLTEQLLQQIIQRPCIQRPFARLERHKQIHPRINTVTLVQRQLIHSSVHIFFITHHAKML